MAEKGAQGSSIGVSRGGRTTKIHALSRPPGRPVALTLTGATPLTYARPKGSWPRRRASRRLAADRGYDADRFRAALREAGTTPVNPGRVNRERPIRHDADRCKERWRIEAAFCPLKDFRRVATRYDKLAANYLSAVALAAVVAFWL